MDILTRYGFEERVFSELKKDFISGSFKEKDNVIRGRVEAPELCEMVQPGDISDPRLAVFSRKGEEAIRSGKLGLVIVNGGMATRFGGVVKGVVEVFDAHSFIDIKLVSAQRVMLRYKTSIPIFIMNSFSTEDVTRKHLEENSYFGLDPSGIHLFNQFIFIRLNPDGSIFVPEDDGLKGYYGPGHGDFIYAFRKSGLLERFIAEGGRYLWFSNVDNLGATIEEMLLGCHIDSGKEMTAELAKKYPGDKGGAPAVVDGRIQIVEGFKFPGGFDQDSIPVFNTATYIFNAESLKKDLSLPWYVVKKKIDGKEVIQFERLAGDLSMFLDTGYVVVKREERFFPIKTPEDLDSQREFLRGKFSG